MATLNLLKRNQRGIIAQVRGEGDVQQRLQEMGLIDGVEIEVLRHAPLGDPMEIRVLDSNLALRRSEAMHVELEEAL